jgi:hypothetical protein
MPSAPSDTQTRKVNSIYYAVDKPGMPKSHDWGVDAEVGKKGEGLLMVQGPLALNFKNRSNGIFPRIENGGLYGNSPPTAERVRLWIDTGISVKGAPEHVFVRLYTHGAQESIMKMLFDDGGFDEMFRSLQSSGASVNFVSARELVSVIRTLESGSDKK